MITCGQFLVAFNGNSGHLAIAMIGTSRVNIYPPPSSDCEIVTTPPADSITLRGRILWLVKSLNNKVN